VSDAPGRLAAYDLHLHSCWSYDATATVASYFERARRTGVRFIAVTDHHVLDGLDDVMDLAARYGDVRTTPAAELTVTASIGSVDLVCYGFPRNFPAPLRDVLEEYHAWQRAAGAAWSRGMTALGYDFSDERRLELLKTYRPARTIELQGATHVANEIRRAYFLERGFIGSEEEDHALWRRVFDEVSFPPYPAVADVVPVVKDLGVLVAIAHPSGYFDGCDETRMDALREEIGFEGVECAHKSVPPEFQAKYRDYCVRRGLFSVAGSDCHHDGDIPRLFARHGGPDEWLDEFLERLGER